MAWAGGKRLNAHCSMIQRRRRCGGKGAGSHRTATIHSSIHTAVPPSSVDHPSFTQGCLIDVCVHVTWLPLSAEGHPAPTEQSTFLRRALLPTQPGRFQHSPSSYYGLTCSWIRQSPCFLEKPRQYSSLGSSSLQGLFMPLMLLWRAESTLLYLSPWSEYPMLSFCLSCSVFCSPVLSPTPDPPASVSQVLGL